MSKHWVFGIHPEYINSIRRVVSDDDRYKLTLVIREKLERAEDPTEGAKPVPNRPGRYTIELLGYIIPFEVLEDKIRLLPVEKANYEG